MSAWVMGVGGTANRSAPTGWRWAMLVVGVLSSLTCGGTDESSRLQAKRRTIRAICDYETGCQLIGPGLTYETRADCETVAGANLDLLWPVETCEGHISPAEVETCITDVQTSACLGASDFFDELSKCQASKICTLP